MKNNQNVFPTDITIVEMWFEHAGCCIVLGIAFIIHSTTELIWFLSASFLSGIALEISSSKIEEHTE